MKTIKYPIKEVDIGQIPNNRILGAGISRKRKILCRKTIESYGLLTPIVAVEKADGPMMVLKGDNELAVLKDMSVDKADVFITRMENDDDIGKVILLLSSLQKEMNHISEGLILKEVLRSGKSNQKKLAVQLGKSESWISKRLSLVERLNENVTAMVLEGKLSPSAAQNIARIPKDRQHAFAMNIHTGGIPKAQIEKLVCAYCNKNTSDSFKDAIVDNPSLARDLVLVTETEKSAEGTDVLFKFEGTLRLLLKLINEFESFFAIFERERILKYSNLIQALKSSAIGMVVLIESISPGKSTKFSGERTGGVDDNN